MKHCHKSHFAATFAGFLVACLCGGPVLAEDIEIYTAAQNASAVRPNVLFVLDTSSSMNSTVSGTGLSRLENMKIALDQILSSVENVNVGLMRFHREGGPVLWPVSDVDASAIAIESGTERTVRVNVTQGVDDATESGGLVSLGDDTLVTGNLAGAQDIVGLRFQNVLIPQGAAIVRASMQFDVPAVDQTSNTKLAIYGELAENADSFDNASLSGRIPTVNEALWDVPAWNSGQPKQTTTDITAVVQEIVNGDNWCGGNAMALFMRGIGARAMYAYERPDAESPALQITYDATQIPADGGCSIKTEVSAITSGNDDVEERTSNGSMYLTSSDLEIVTDGSRDQVIGLRFRDVDVPSGTELLDARIEFTGESESPNFTGAVSVTINAHLTGDSPAFTQDNYNASSRGRTGASVGWNVPNLGNNERIKTPNLSAIVQEVIDSGSWASGNAMTFLIEGSGRRNVRSANGGAGPVLYLTFRGKEQALVPGGGGDVTVRERMREIVQSLVVVTGTPIVDSLYEASLYYRGDEVDYGTRRGDQGSGTEYSRVSHAASYSGGTLNQPGNCSDSNLNHTDCRGETISGSPTYISPMEYSCQANYIVLLSDGSPSRLNADGKIASMIAAEDPTFSGCSNPVEPRGVCGEELLEFMRTKDQNGALDGTNTVKTYTIGFNLQGDADAVQYNKDLADAGGGSFYEAQSAADLVNVFQNILTEVQANNTTFNSPGISVNSFNRTSHNEEVYFSLFKPGQSPHWDGNLKRYSIGYNASDELVILDANGNPAVDDTGFFSSDAKSEWTTGQADGGEVTAGGALQQLGANRDVYVELGGALVKLNENDNAQVSALSGLWPTLDNDGVKNLIKWMRGVNPDGEIRRSMGDPLHSRPVVMTYGGTEANPDTTVFLGTNDGYLHAIDGETGEEHFAVIPGAVLADMPRISTNGGNSKFYGVDGRVTTEKTEGGDINLYFGLRRGGEHYYSLDVTNRNSPSLRWSVSSSDQGLGKLGQTWSRPMLATINDNGTARTVVFVGGGYDTDQDAAAYSEDTVGNAIFMLDAADGDLLWSASSDNADLVLPDMVNSIPSDIRVLELTGDGYADRLYVGDMGGRLWRFDIHNGNSVSGPDPFITGGKIASLGAGDMDTPTVAENRRFYYAPDVALVRRDQGDFLNIAIGSGYRAHPLDVSTNDAFYSIWDPYVFDTPGATDPNDAYSFDYDYGIVDKATAGDGEVSVTDLTDESVLLPDNSVGWKIDLPNVGEKVLAEARTFQGQIFFTTYTPGVINVNPCSPAVGQARAYLVDLKGAPVAEERFENLDQGTIPTEPVIMFLPPPDDEGDDGDNGGGGGDDPNADDEGDGDVEDGDEGSRVGCFIGPEPCPASLINTPTRTYWREDDAD